MTHVLKCPDCDATFDPLDQSAWARHITTPHERTNSVEEPQTPEEAYVEEVTRHALLHVNNVLEWDDRTSPEGYEQYLFMTPKELQDVLVQFAERLAEAEIDK